MQDEGVVRALAGWLSLAFRWRLMQWVAGVANLRSAFILD